MKPSVKLDDCLLLQSWSVQVKMELLMVKAVCGGICGRKVHCPTQGLTYLSWWPLLISSSPTSSSRIPPSGTFILFIAGEHNNSVCLHQWVQSRIPKKITRLLTKLSWVQRCYTCILLSFFSKDFTLQLLSSFVHKVALSLLQCPVGLGYIIPMSTIINCTRIPGWMSYCVITGYKNC